MKKPRELWKLINNLSKNRIKAIIGQDNLLLLTRSQMNLKYKNNLILTFQQLAHL